MLNSLIKLDKETRELLEEFLQDLKDLNENLLDLKQMIAPWLGFYVKIKKVKER